MKTNTILVKVKPRARTSRLEQCPDGSWSAEIKAPPVDGKANTELIRIISKHFKCPKASVVIKSGAGAKLKLIQISVAD